MLPIMKILDYLQKIRDLLGSGYSVELTVKKVESEQPEDSSADKDSDDLASLAKIFSPEETPKSDNEWMKDADVLTSSEIRQRIAKAFGVQLDGE